MLSLFKISWWRHQMRTFSALLALYEGNPPVTGGFPHKGQGRGALMFSLTFAWTNGWANNRDAGDLRGLHVHCDVTVMCSQGSIIQCAIFSSCNNLAGGNKYMKLNTITHISLTRYQWVNCVNSLTFRQQKHYEINSKRLLAIDLMLRLLLGTRGRCGQTEIPHRKLY